MSASKRALPSWISARDDKNGKKAANESTCDNGEVDGTHKKAKGQGKTGKDYDGESESGKRPSSAGPSGLDFSNLLDGVVFVLSGFVNPERGILRSQALEMGAEYQLDWNPNCTLLVCAFPNTPKFRQVEADGGTIVSKDWIKECYAQKKLVDIETYLMNIGKPWRKTNISSPGNQDHGATSPAIARKPDKQPQAERISSSTSSPAIARNPDKQPQAERISSSTSKNLKVDSSKRLNDKFSPSKVKKWVIDDFNKTLTWLESQEEKPEPCEIRNVAAEGVLACLQDAIDLLEKKQDLRQLTEQWSMVPRVVEELLNIQGTENSPPSIFKEALSLKKIYEGELKMISNTSNKNNKEAKPMKRDKGKAKLGTEGDKARKSTDYDSDETMEMTEEEIDLAYNSIASTKP